MQQEVEQEVEQSLVRHQLLCLPYQLCSNQLLKLKKHRISAIKGKNTIMGGGGEYSLKWPLWESSAQRALGYTFFRLQAYGRIGISLVKVYEKVRKSISLVGKKAQKG